MLDFRYPKPLQAVVIVSSNHLRPIIVHNRTLFKSVNHEFMNENDTPNPFHVLTIACIFYDNISYEKAALGSWCCGAAGTFVHVVFTKPLEIISKPINICMIKLTNQLLIRSLDN